LRYFARLPTYSAESGLLTLCAVYFLLLPSDPAVTSNALAIRIIFPLIRVIPPSFRRLGLPTSLGKQKSRIHVCEHDLFWMNLYFFYESIGIKQFPF